MPLSVRSGTCGQESAYYGHTEYRTNASRPASAAPPREQARSRGATARARHRHLIPSSVLSPPPAKRSASR
ncbi:MAG: hypothetical protein AVDCRST_MAG68-4117 [uncultured Gemmatimonadetes bacterium]|uniref:Uncharacterized protein n=1 Tax=uncultured Gemmatimonadota bacterium TaxID=203437 RepID=A0A6J4MGE3_9BACT|nr:MAG: hypothetical protein AVDCRST_MAG68-4117 [uncultured Gemmatimonadota bacterium]